MSIFSQFQISVIIPTFNRAQEVDRALQSVFKQSFKPHEIIVVDDGSTDETAKLIKQCYTGSVRYVYQSNSGVSRARNRGVSCAQGNWIAFLDSDDEWLPEKLLRQISSLSENPSISFCHTDEIWIRHGKRINPMHKHRKQGGWIYEKCLPLCVISPSSVLIKKDIFETLGGFDESLPACEDYDYWLRYCCRYPVLFVEEPLLIKHGGHSDQLSKKYWGLDRFRVKSMLKLLMSDVLSPNQRFLTENAFIEKCRILENGALKHGNKNMSEYCIRMREQLKEVCHGVQ